MRDTENGLNRSRLEEWFNELDEEFMRINWLRLSLTVVESRVDDGNATSMLSRIQHDYCWRSA